MIQVFDINLDFIGVLEEYISFQATTNYCDVGTFELECIYNENVLKMLKKFNFIRYKDFVGRIDTIQYIKSEEEAKINVKGEDLNGFLKMRVCYQEYSANTRADNWVRTLVKKNCIYPDCGARRGFPYLTLGVDNHLPATTDSTTNKGTVLEEIQEVLDNYDYGFRTTVDFKEKYFYFEVFAGAPRNDIVIERQYDNVKAQDYVFSNNKEQNVVYAISEEADIVVNDELYSGYDRKEYCIDSGLSTSDKEIGTLTKLKQMLRKEAKAEIVKASECVDVDVYGVELFVGDIVKIRSRDWDLSFEKTVRSKTIVLENGTETISYIIGNDI